MNSRGIFDCIVRAWVIPSHKIPESVDAIISTSQGVFEKKLVMQNQQHMEKVLLVSEEHPEALIGYSAFAGSFDPKVEVRIKQTMLYGKKSIFAGYVSNTSSEAVSYHQKLVENLGREPETVVLITSQFHGRAVRLVYGKEFPNSQVILVFTPWQGEINKKDLHVLSRNKWLWLLANIARQAMIALPLGYWLFKKLDIRQPNTKQTI